MKILQQNNEILRQRAQKVDPEDISSEKIQNLIKELKKTLDETEKGVAIASPQIGKSIRIFVVSDKIFEKDFTQNFVFINPEFIEYSEEKEWGEEGCLSIEKGDVYGEVERFSKCTIKALDERGNKFTQKAEEFLARIFQHEIDHLDGILFIDKAKNLEKIQPNTN